MDADTKRSMQFYDAMAWLDANRKLVAAVAALIGALIVVYLFWNWRKEVNAQEASKALFAIQTGLGPNSEDAINPDAYLKVASDHKGTPAGQHASLLAAGELFEAKKFSEAQAQFEKFGKDFGDSTLAGQAAFGVAASLEAQGKANEAIAKYREVSTRHANDSVGGLAKLSLARLYEKQNQPEEALRIYDDLTRLQDPSSWTMQARQLRQDLLEAHPNLVKPSTPPVVTTTNVPVQGTPATGTLIRPANP